MFLACEFASLSISFFLYCNFHNKSAICAIWCTDFISIILQNFYFQIFGMSIFSHANFFFTFYLPETSDVGGGGKGAYARARPLRFWPGPDYPPPRFLAPTLQLAPPDFQTLRHPCFHHMSFIYVSWIIMNVLYSRSNIVK